MVHGFNIFYFFLQKLLIVKNKILTIFPPFFFFFFFFPRTSEANKNVGTLDTREQKKSYPLNNDSMIKKKKVSMPRGFLIIARS